MNQQARYDTENALARKHRARLITGMDEVGHGALAGPLVVCAFVRQITTPLPATTRDSKLLTPRARKKLVPELFKAANAWSCGIVTSKEIDMYGMTWAQRTGFNRALASLSRVPDLVLYDGRAMTLTHPNAQNIINGDETHASISAASIIAKVLRDTLMYEYDTNYPHFGFAKHKGYGTRMHLKALRRHGPIPFLHRTRFISHLV